MLANEVCQERNLTIRHLLDIIEDRFEELKRRFNPYDSSQPHKVPVHIGIDGVEVGQVSLDRYVFCIAFVTAVLRYFSAQNH